MMNYIKKGASLVLDEIQNASVNTQVSLQEALDSIAMEALHDPHSWRRAGSVIIMGSLPDAVDTMLEHHMAPLYHRIHAKVTVP